LDYAEGIKKVKFLQDIEKDEFKEFLKAFKDPVWKPNLPNSG
jgi:glutamate formiminotransferase